jgi:hypothetical protein
VDVLIATQQAHRQRYGFSRTLAAAHASCRAKG